MEILEISSMTDYLDKADGMGTRPTVTLALGLAALQCCVHSWIADNREPDQNETTPEPLLPLDRLSDALNATWARLDRDGVGAQPPELTPRRLTLLREVSGHSPALKSLTPHGDTATRSELEKLADWLEPRLRNDQIDVAAALMINDLLGDHQGDPDRALENLKQSLEDKAEPSMISTLAHHRPVQLH